MAARRNGNAPVAAALRAARGLVFDFDGTLVDSAPIKVQGFEIVFGDYPDRLEEIMAYCRGAEHTARGDKFRHVYEVILGRDLPAAEMQRLQARYAAATTDRIVAAVEIPGAARFLASIRGPRPTALVSTTPHAVLLDIVTRRGWTDLFGTVRGAPVDKAEWLRAWSDEHGLATADVVMFGDSQEDARAARIAGCRFVAVAAAETIGDRRLSIADFTGLLVQRRARLVPGATKNA